MKNVRLHLCTIIILLFGKLIFAHDAPVHQYVVKQAYYLLEHEKGVIPGLRDRIGLDYNGAGDNNFPWSTGYIGVGAEREDLEDPIWGYGGAFNGWTPTVTHFWDADFGDDVTTPITASPNAPNAFYKAKLYLFGGHNIFIQVKGSDVSLGGMILGRFYSYSSLVEFYKTGRCFEEGYIDDGGYPHYFTPHNEVYMDLETARRYAAQILGRVAHLLTDMSVPAHTHNDLHADGDLYEDYMSQHYTEYYNELPFIEPIYWDATNAARQGRLLDVYQNVCVNDPIRQVRYLFYTLNQIADRFPSNDSDGDNVYTTNYNGDNYSELSMIQGINHLYSAGSVNTHQVNEYAFRYCIRAVAGLFYWFAKETGIITELRINITRNFENQILDAQPSIIVIKDVSSTIQSPNTLEKNGSTYYFSCWSDGNTQNPRTFNSDVTIQAIYKEKHISTTDNNFQNTGQRKFLRTNNGLLHLVYESMNGKAWYESSTDNGTSWNIANNGAPLNNFQTASEPSMAYYDNDIAIVYTNGGQVYLEYIPDNSTILQPSKVCVSNTIPLLNNCSHPVVAIGKNGYFMVAWKGISVNKQKIFYRLGKIDTYYRTIYWLTDSNNNPITGSLSDKYWSFPGIQELYPTIEANNSVSAISTPTFHLAWQEGGIEGQEAILYTKFTVGSNGNGTYTLNSTHSYSPSACIQARINQSPSIIALPDGTSRLCWKGSIPFDDEEEPPCDVIFKDPTDPDNEIYWDFGPSNDPPVIALGSECYYIGWNCPYWGVPSVGIVGSVTLGNCKFIFPGHDSKIQMNGNGTRSQMNIIGMKSVANGKWTFIQPQPIISILKENQNNKNITSGKMAILSKDDSPIFSCTIGDIELGDQLIQFIETNDSTIIKNKTHLNNYLTSLPFKVTDQSKLSYFLNYGIIDSLKNAKNIKGKDFISLRVELIDAKSNKIYEAFSKVLINVNSSMKFHGERISINLNGIGNAEVRIRLNIDDNINPKYSLINICDAKSSLSKRTKDVTTKEIIFNGEKMVKEFNLFQNYPNPFNPTTTISYALPFQSMVEIKIFDIMGNEIKTLVSNPQEAGYHSLQWNGRNTNNEPVSSGIYIYKLRAVSYEDSKVFAKAAKMTVVK